MSDEKKQSTSPPSHDNDHAPNGTPPVSESSETVADASTYTVDDPYDYSSDPYSEPYTPQAGGADVPAAVAAEPPPPTPPSETPAAEDDDDDEGMVRMSFLEHLEELRSRIIKGLAGLGVAFLVCLYFSERLWGIVQEPAAAALRSLGYTDAALVFTSPMESFTIIWIKLPLLVSVFVASPWILYQTWAFIAPGLYKKERRLAGPFVVSTAGLFFLGGIFAYFIAFRFGLKFLLGIGKDVGVRPMITITDYFDIFVNVMLGVGVVFELPVLIFFLTLLRIASPRFLLAHSRYAILGIVILAAVITPTPDVFNLMLFSVPMVVLYFIGIFASFILVMNREGKKFPWPMVLGIVALVAVLIAGALYVAVTRLGYHWLTTWPFLSR
jgi:sec-independent protein translocase protein TatC